MKQVGFIQVFFHPLRRWRCEDGEERQGWKKEACCAEAGLQETQACGCASLGLCCPMLQ
jgi:hypothetical protein